MRGATEEPQSRGTVGFRKGTTLPDKVAQFYYTLGLFTSTHPLSLLLTGATIFILSCYPLIHFPLPGNFPTIVHQLNASENYDSPPFCFVQQVVIRTAVLPWGPYLTVGDAFRAPLYESFKLLEIVRNYQDETSSKTLGHLCLHVETLKVPSTYYEVLPQYSCLVLSPANFWHQDVQKFSEDDTLLATIFSRQNYQKGKTSLAEVLFGMHMFDTGIKRCPYRRRPRVIQYAVTLVFREYDEGFINGLRSKLRNVYSLHQNFNESSLEENKNSVIIQYPGDFSYTELTPVFFVFLMIFFYYYFSVRKIETIHFKLGLTFAVITTVYCSLSMTLGICFFFGFTLTRKSFFFVYLAILVGVENILVLTESIVSIPSYLDVNVRIAQGLSKEGWTITKTLLLEITIFTFGLFTFVPLLQEYSLFAIIFLITNWFLQIVFFVTILSRQLKKREHLLGKANFNFRTFNNLLNLKPGLNRSQSFSRLPSYPTDVVAGQVHGVQEQKIPKRVRIFNCWAKTRLIQRSFMILMVAWISSIAYNSRLIENYFINTTMIEDVMNDQNESLFMKKYEITKILPLHNTNKSFKNVNYVTQNPLQETDTQIDVEKLKHTDSDPWLRLPLQHWSFILRKYNISLSGKRIVILPPIKLSHLIPPEDAVVMRNPDEKFDESLHWHALAAALDPFESKAEYLDGKAFYPSTPMELMFTTVLCIISIVVLAYAFVVLYRCICSRNYAEWRASWFNEKKQDIVPDNQVLLEAVPISLEGHSQEIECVASDGNNIVSSCLGGVLRVWDSSTAETVSTIDRIRFFGGNIESSASLPFKNSSKYDALSPKTSKEDLYDLNIAPRINTKFSHNSDNNNSSIEKTENKYNFVDSYNKIYHQLDSPLRNFEREGLNHRRSSSKFASNRNSFSDNMISNFEISTAEFSPIWCMDFMDNLIAIGCANGRIEFWEGSTGQLKCTFDEGNSAGVTGVKILGSRVVAARLYGTLDFLTLQTFNHGQQIDWSFTRSYRKTHIRTNSTGSIADKKVSVLQGLNHEIKCVLTQTVRAHQQSITCLECVGNRVVTGSQDHTLKVFGLCDGRPFYTLHGHFGPITCLFIDAYNPDMSGSGSQDGMLCIWDLLSGACLYNIQAHNGSIMALTYSASYVISLGTDERMCVWERFQGHLLNCVYVTQTFSSQLLMLAQHLVVTTRNGCLAIWDVRSGECVKTVALGRSPFVFIKQLVLLRDAVLCDYGNQLRIIRFPLVGHKFD